MIYKQFKDLKLSALGFGTMRFPQLSEDPADIDQAQVDEMVQYALDNGVNYFDTAYMYHKGDSEKAIGKALKKHPRESFYLADKFPGMSDEQRRSGEKIFEEQLAKCQVEYFDFYLLHNVSEPNLEGYLDESTGLMEYLLKQKENGRIKHFGFSCHAQIGGLEKFLEKYHDVMEFCQLQVNWLDWKLQAAKDKVALCEKYNIPVWVMEPVRGGRLAALEDKYAAMLKEVEPEWTAPQWALRFVNNVPAVTMILSGMSNMQQMKENIATFSEFVPLEEKHLKVLSDAADDILKSGTLPCTGCRYCTSYCPIGMPIPELIKVYNDANFNNNNFYAARVISNMPEDKRPSACLQCGQCVSVCPQAIDVPKMMMDLDARFEQYKADQAKKA